MGGREVVALCRSLSAFTRFTRRVHRQSCLCDNLHSASGGGLTGLVLQEDKHRLYTLTRFDNSIAIIDTISGGEIGHVPMYNPEPPSVIAGRPFLYDTSFSSSHGDSSCASCHVSGDFDSLAWDLGNPDGAVQPIPGPFEIPPRRSGCRTPITR